jgi:hypothetical protein
VIFIVTVYALWLFFLAVMNLYRAYKLKTISKTALILGYPILVMGAALDVFVNVTIASVVFMDLPRHWLLTQRLADYKANDKNWRGKLATWICHDLLDAFDITGNHCG